MKPISELANDREACERVFTFLLLENKDEDEVIFDSVELYNYADFGIYYPDDGCGTCQVTLTGRFSDLRDQILVIITNTGIVGFRSGELLGDVLIEYNPFAFVKLMNELGYGPEETN